MFTNVVKPTHACNLACTYCYNEDDRNIKMPLNILKELMDKTCIHTINHIPDKKLEIIWHGGEPTLMGVNFYEEAMKYQSKYSDEINIVNVLQTNGMKIDEEWCKFFIKHNWNISVSLDGIKEVNDLTRVRKNGKGSFDSVFNNIRLINKHNISLGICLVLNKNNVGRMKETYQFLKQERLNFNIIPMTYAGSAIDVMDDIGLSPEEYATAWIELFDCWFFDDDPVFCSDFVNKSTGILNKCGADCVGIKNCASSVISTDHNGNIYPCATMSADEHWIYGNIKDYSISQLLSSKNAFKANNRTVDNNCLHCKWRANCNGGCMSRSDKFFKTVNERDYYCPGLFRIYEHIAKRLNSNSEINIDYMPATQREIDTYYSSKLRENKCQIIYTENI